MARTLGLLPRLALALVPGLVLGLALSTVPAQAGAAPTPASTARLAPAAAVQGVVPSRLLVQRLLEDRVVALTNVHRRARGCAPLRTNAYLRKAARGHTVRMALREVMSHQLPGEPRFTTRITNAGYTRWRRVAENVARGFAGPRDVVRAWMQSPGHRRNILDCRLRDLGVGVVLRDGQLWWTQNFGRR
ncbi:MAG TPA: CAP domain-containing protein [Nocardioides sp.]|nr:CAP domain-containing protein [Nocardioides sp.]